MLVVKEFAAQNHAACQINISHGINQVSFMPSPHGGREQLWFHIRLGNPGCGDLPPKTRIRIENWNNALCAVRGRFVPVFRYGDTAWRRLSFGTIVPRGDGYFAVEWEIDTPHFESDFEMAFCFPYAEEEFSSLLRDTSDYWCCNTIGVSGKGRIFRRLSNTYGSSAQPKRGFYLMARQHAAETSGAWVLDGVLRRLAQLRADFPVWCIPFADPDGVAEGNYGKDSFPQDINRAWGPNAPMRHETLLMGADLRQWRTRIVPESSLVMDFHSPGAEESDMYAFSNLTETMAGSLRAGLELLPVYLRDFADEKFFRVSTHKKKSAWGDQFNLGEFSTHLLGIGELSFETSYFEAHGKILAIEDYQTIGSRIADWMVENDPSSGIGG